MTKLLEEAFVRLRDLPEDMQDMAARQLIRQFEEEPGAWRPRSNSTMGRRHFANGDFVTLGHGGMTLGLPIA